MPIRHLSSDPTIDEIAVSTYTIPTDFPESDGTFAWEKTTVVLVEAPAGGETGIGYGYADLATARLITELLATAVRGRSAMAVPGAWEAMRHAIRNLGRPGLSSMAISAVDNALWDLKAKVLGVPLVTLLGPAKQGVVAHGSGGFTSYSIAQLQRQLDAGAVDILQADATRCDGITEFLHVGALCAARSLRLSAYTAPSLHGHPCCGLAVSYNVEYFHDHARIEHLLFDGALTPIDVELRPDLSRPGIGLELKRADAAKYAD